ncbi:MAG TPA: F0F1 ATP synthase subunit B [Roseiarcus sp.]|nr:F0F1 ATP synthase subunit B [Roseiarcus sp.]
MAQPETTQTEVGHEGGGQSNFPPFDASNFPSQLLWFAVAFVFLYWFMSKRALPQIGRVIEERRARIAKDLDDATAMQQQADAAAAAHEKTLAEARANAQALAQSARDQAAAETDARRKAVDAELAGKIAEAEKQIAATRARAMASVAEIAREAAGAIVERLGGRAADPAAVKAAVEKIGA